METPLRYTSSEYSNRYFFISALVVSLAGFLITQFCAREDGIRFSDEAFYITGAWKLVTTGSISIPKKEILQEGRPGNFFVPGRNDRFYSMNPIGFSLVLAVFYKIAGWTGITLSGRLFFSITLLLLYRLFRFWTGQPEALTAMIFMAVSPIMLFQSAMVMTHIFSLLVQTAGLLLLIGASKSNIGFRSFTVGLLWGIATLVRLDFILMVIPLFVTLWIRSSELIDGSMENRSAWRFMVKIILTAYWGYALGLSVLLGYRAYYLGSAFKSGYNASYQSSIAFAPLSSLPRRFLQAFRRLQEAGLPYILFPAVPGLYYLIRKAGRRSLILLSWSIPYFCFYVAFRFGTKHVFNTRYFIPVLPLLALSASILILRPVFVRKKPFLAICIILALITPNFRRGYFMLKQRDSVLSRQRQLIRTIEQKVPANSVLFLPGAVALTMAVKNEPYDIRETIYVIGPYPDDDTQETDPPDNAKQLGQPKRLLSNSAATTRRMNPDLLPDLLSRSKEHQVYLAVFSRFEKFIRDHYDVQMLKLFETHSSMEEYVLYRIESKKR